jgi:hypothetical protein
MRYLMASVLCALALGVGAAQPTDAAPDFAPIIGTGQFTCGQFMEYREQKNPRQHDVIVQWVWGFLSAYNVRGNFGTQWQRLSHIDSLPDSPTVLLYLEAHCRKYPLDTVLDGTFALIVELHGSIAWKDR